MVEPPKTLTIQFCPTCGRTDRFVTLKENHYHGGKRCEGKPITVTYSPRGEMA